MQYGVRFHCKPVLLVVHNEVVYVGGYVPVDTEVVQPARYLNDKLDVWFRHAQRAPKYPPLAFPDGECALNTLTLKRQIVIERVFLRSEGMALIWSDDVATRDKCIVTDRIVLLVDKASVQQAASF